jgi:hypothetical protein
MILWTEAVILTILCAAHRGGRAKVAMPNDLTEHDRRSILMHRRDRLAISPRKTLVSPRPRLLVTGLGLNGLEWNTLWTPTL